MLNNLDLVSFLTPLHCHYYLTHHLSRRRRPVFVPMLPADADADQRFARFLQLCISRLRHTIPVPLSCHWQQPHAAGPYVQMPFEKHAVIDFRFPSSMDPRPRVGPDSYQVLFNAGSRIATIVKGQNRTDVPLAA